jgi:choline dehydrogenase
VDRYFEFERTEVHEAAVQAMEAVGIPGLADHNMPGAVGVGRMPMSGRNGDRVSVADAYLHPGHAPPNLTIRPDAVVGRILFDGFRARGVELVDTTVIEAGWVVVSAGVFGSPPLLMRSGIGPSDHLRSLGITPLVDLGGVGANLGDHPGTDLDCGYQGGGRADPLLHSIATLHSEQASTTEPPDLLLWVADPSEQPGETPAFYIDIVLLKPRARGSIRLRSVDPTDPPQVELPDWRGGSDLDRLVEGYRVALEVAHRAELRSLCRPAMGLEEKAEDLRDVIRNNSWSVPHFVGGCSMGPADNPMAVVDATGRVHGTEALSVVDASIIPIVPSGFTHLPTIMLAERLAGQIGAVL